MSTALSILLAEDDEPVRRMLGEMLQAVGHKVVSAEDGDKALDALGREPVDLVVTDMLMPNKDGLELIQSVHKMHPTLLIVAISGGGRHLDRRCCLTIAKYLGATVTLSKPFNLQEIRSAIDEAWAHPRGAIPTTLAS